MNPTPVPSAPTAPISAVVLESANAVIHGERAKSYGSAEESFGRIAALWEDYLGVNINAHDVAMMMVLLKVSRAKSDTGIDTAIDIAGYAALSMRMER